MTENARENVLFPFQTPSPTITRHTAAAAAAAATVDLGLAGPAEYRVLADVASLGGSRGGISPRHGVTSSTTVKRDQPETVTATRRPDGSEIITADQRQSVEFFDERGRRAGRTCGQKKSVSTRWLQVFLNVLITLYELYCVIEGGGKRQPTSIVF